MNARARRDALKAKLKVMEAMQESLDRTDYAAIDNTTAKLKTSVEAMREAVHGGDKSKEELLELVRKGKQEVRQSEAEIALAKKRLALVQALATGKLEQRFLVALRAAPQALYRRCYPRRYRDVPSHYSPKYLLLMAIAERMYDDAGLGQHEDNLKVIGDIEMLCDLNVPTYWLTQAATRRLIDTEVMDVKITADDFEWPHQSFVIMPPKDCFKNSPVLMTITKRSEWVVIQAVCPGLGKGRIVEVTEADPSVKPAQAAKIARSINGRGEPSFNALSFPANMPIGKALKDAFKTSEYPDDSGPLAQLAINTLLAMVAEPTFTRCELTKPMPVEPNQARKAPDDLWSQNYLDFQCSDVQITRVGSGHHDEHGTKRPHVRRGHWRTRWVPGGLPDQMSLAVGYRAIVVTDLRRTVTIKEIEGEGVLVTDALGVDHVVALCELKPAVTDIKWIKRQFIGLKARYLPQDHPPT